MKYALTIIIALAIFTACKKKSTPTHCFSCINYDSFLNNKGWHIFPNGINDTICNENQAFINLFVINHVPYDTFYKGTDSVGYGYTYFRCSLGN